MARLPAPLRRAALRVVRRLGPLGAQRERWLPLVAAGVVLALLGAALLLGRPGPVVESREIVLEDAQPDTALAALDTDHDGLSDLEEVVSGTSPGLNDTDGDGLPDLWEVRHAKLDPLSNTYCPDPLVADAARDCDQDGLSTLDEFIAGTDPNVADVDGDGLPDGLEVACGSDPFTRDADADPDRDGLTNLQEMQLGTRCDREDTDGDGLTDPEELDVTHTNPVRASTSGSGIADGWLQAFQLPLDDAGVGFQDADRDGLTNLEEYQATLALALRQHNDTLQGHPLLSFFLRGLDPFRADTDGDGMSDAYEVRFGLDPLDPGLADPRLGPDGDPDGDNLPNKLEAVAGSNPFQVDSDGDGLTDFEEVTTGWEVRVGDKVRNVTSDPSRADTDGDGLSDLEEKQGRATRGGVSYVFSLLDPRSPDTDLDGLGDLQEVTLPISSPVEPRRLDPTNPDTDGDGLLDGEEYTYWLERQQAQGADFEGLLDRLEKQVAAGSGSSINREQAVQALGPGGDADGDSRPNILDGDSDGDGIPDGRELAPEEKAVSPGSHFRRALPATDPALADSDGDLLPDAWENEFAVYDFTLSDWNLNASNRDSLQRHDGRTDADRDLDHDGVSYNGSRYATPVSYEHTNLLEFFSNTKPNVADTDGDGLSDGWEVYFTCIAAAAPKRICGTLQRSEDATTTIDLDPTQLDSDHDGVPDGGETAQVAPYVRFLRPATGQTLDEVARALDPVRAERFDRQVNGGPADLTNDLFGNAEHPAVVRVHGQYVLNFTEAFLTALDPARGDTDGDGMPDAFELAKGLNPLDTSDALIDSDGDGLTNLKEFGLGSDPLPVVCEVSKPAAPDTDCGGLDDGKDPNPLYPPDDAPDGDTDCDGVLNKDEGPAGTSLADPDSDRDGLLDGPSMAFYETTEEFQDGRPVLVRASRILGSEGCRDSFTLATLEAKFRGLGVAAIRSTSGVIFLGENPFGTKPAVADTDGDGLPDGWEAYWVELHHAQGANDPLIEGVFNDGDALNNNAEYRAGMPPDWAERGCGVWWLGLDPRDGDTDGDGVLDGAFVDGVALGGDFDVDNDGLDAFTGEDPAPYDPSNAGPDPLASCASYTDFVDHFVFRGERRRSPDADGNGIPDRLDYARTKLVEVHADLDPDGILPADERGNNILKGSRFTVRGRVVVNETGASQGAGVPGVVVEVNLGRSAADRTGLEAGVVGLAVTDAQGAFEVQAALARERNATLPGDAVVFAARHAAGETLTWQPDTTAWPPGADYRLIVGTLSRQEGPSGSYNFTSGTGNGVFQARGARGTFAVSGPGAVPLDLPLLTVKTESRITIPTNLSVIAGERLKVHARATDALGDPLPRASLENGLVRVGWLGQTYKVRPEVAIADGAIDLDLLTTTSTALGLHDLTIDYLGSGSLVNATSLSVPVDVRYATNISGTVLNEGLRAVAGEAIRVEGRVRDVHGRALPAGLPVEARLAGGVYPTNTTDTGTFAVDGTVPTDGTVGTQVVEVAFLGGGGYEPSRAEAGLVTLLQRTTLTIDTQRSPLGRDLVVTGSLVDLAGNPVDDPTEDLNATVRVTTPVRDGVANVTGAHWFFTVPRDLLPGAGTLVVRAEFGGSQLFRGSSDAREVQLTSRTTLRLDPAPVPRGVPGAIHGQLRDEKGQGAGGEIVLVTFGNLTGAASTDGAGNFTFEVALPREAPLGGLVAEARYDGGRGGLLEAADPASAVMQVVAPSALTLQDYTGPLGPVPVRGRLVGDDGAGIAGAKLLVTLGSAPLGTAVTDLEGRFDGELPLPASLDPGAHVVRARFAGTGTQGASQVDATYRLLTHTNLTIERVHALVRGVEGSVLARLRDAAGQPLGARQVELRIEGVSVAHGFTDAGGLATIVGAPPQHLQPGLVSVAVRFPGDDGHTGAEATAKLPLGARTDLSLDLPGEVEQGALFRGVIVLQDDAGHGLAKQVVVVNFSRFAYPLTLTTDDAGRANFTGRIEGSGFGTLVVRYAGSEGRAPAERSIQVQSKAPILAGAGPLGIVALLAAAVIVGAAVASRILRRAQVSEVEGILREAGQRLFASTEYQASILWAYQRLTAHVRDRGFLVKDSFTAREFVEALAEAVPAGKHHLERLATVFEEARYSPHPIGPRQRDEALAALRAIEADLRGQALHARLEVVRAG